MDLSELTKIVVCRIQKLNPDNVGKIMGFILLKEPCDEEMLKLAFGPENTLISIIDEAKKTLGFSSPNHPSISSQNQSVFDPLYSDSIREEVNSLSSQAQFLSLEEKIDSFSLKTLSSRTSRRSPSLCHYFYKGYCKHGANCRYYHGQFFPEDYYQAFCSNFNDLKIEENCKSLEKLEMEIFDLLKSRNGAPVSIAVLPLLYYEKYGRSLQAYGYLTESQRHGKAGFSLTKLLACLKNSIRVIDRPHGQHSVVLARDASKYLECRHERSEPIGIGTSLSSHQIYLTFPADSTFNEDDVLSYFKLFGPVKDVRIPCQEKRMYGFVSFLHPETVCEILMKRNVHYICGSRVLAKPYKGKSRMVDRSYVGKNKLSMHYPYQYIDLESEPSGIPRETNSFGTIKSYWEERQKMIELERSRLVRFNLAQEPIDQQHYFNNYGVDESKLLEDHNHIPFEDHLGFSFGFVRTKNNSNNSSDKESGHIELPDNPFALEVAFKH